MPKKIPLRTCVGCREMKPKKELIRVVKSPEGGGLPGFQGEEAGPRGSMSAPTGVLRAGAEVQALERAFSAAMPDGSTTRWRREIEETGAGIG